MKRQYMKPAIQLVKIQHQCQILVGSPDAHDEVGGSGQFARRFNDWDDEEME